MKKYRFGYGGLQEKALSLLLNLSLDDDNKVGLVAEGAIGRIVGALLGGRQIAELWRRLC